MCRSLLQAPSVFRLSLRSLKPPDPSQFILIYSKWSLNGTSFCCADTVGSHLFCASALSHFTSSHTFFFLCLRQLLCTVTESLPAFSPVLLVCLFVYPCLIACIWCSIICTEVCTVNLLHTSLRFIADDDSLPWNFFYFVHYLVHYFVHYLVST